MVTALYTPDCDAANDKDKKTTEKTNITTLSTKLSPSEDDKSFALCLVFHSNKITELFFRNDRDCKFFCFLVLS